MALLAGFQRFSGSLYEYSKRIGVQLDSVELSMLLFGKKSEKIPSVSQEFRELAKAAPKVEPASPRKPEVIEVLRARHATTPDQITDLLPHNWKPLAPAA